MTPIARMILFFAIMFAIPASVLAGGLTGTVVSVNGLDVTIKIDSFGPFSPAVGDRVDVIEVADGGKVEFDIGDWEVTEVDGKMVKAVAVNALGINPPKVKMKAVIHLSPGPVHAGAPPAATRETKKQSVAGGKVIMLRGKNVTIQLEDGKAQAAVGDVVELSFTTAGVVIPVGTWRVSALKEDGVIEATPLAPEGEPTIDMDARVFTDASKKEKRVDSKKKPDQPDASKIEDGDRSPLETACLKGNANACNKLGVMYATGKGVTLNLSRAVELYRKACDIGSAVGCSNLGFMYRNGEGLLQDKVQAATYFKRACDGGYAGGCTTLGLMYERATGVSQDNKAAAHYYQRGCDSGDIDGCTNLGYMYEYGYGVSEDKKSAVEYYRKGCEAGNARGCTNLGHLYEKGHGVSRDDKLAADYYRKGCEQENALGCTNLGFMYEKGRGVNQDEKLAVDYYRSGCKQGDALGCTNLGFMYEKGYGVSQDNGLAADYYHIGCDGGSGRGCGNLGWLVYHGRGTTPDRARGKKLLEKSCGMGFAWSCDRLKEIGK